MRILWVTYQRNLIFQNSITSINQNLCSECQTQALSNVVRFNIRHQMLHAIHLLQLSLSLSALFLKILFDFICVWNFHLFRFRHGGHYEWIFQWHNNRILHHSNCVDCWSVRRHLLHYTNHQTTLAQVKSIHSFHIWVVIYGAWIQKIPFPYIGVHTTIW